MDFKDQLKSSVDLVAVVGEYVRLKKSGSQRYMGLCPFHNEKTPSFTVHAAYQFYKCFSCGEGGDVFAFVQKLEGISFYEAMKLLAERHGIPMPKRSLVADEDSKLREAIFRMHELALENFRANLRGASGEEARAYPLEYGLRTGCLPDWFGLVVEAAGDPHSSRWREVAARGPPSEASQSSAVAAGKGASSNGFTSSGFTARGGRATVAPVRSVGRRRQAARASELSGRLIAFVGLLGHHPLADLHQLRRGVGPLVKKVGWLLVWCLTIRCGEPTPREKAGAQ